MNDYLYSQEHLWFLIQENKPVIRFGFTEFAILPGRPQYLSLPPLGKVFNDANSELGCLETEKCAISITLPFAVRIVNVNVALCDDPALLLNGNMTENWLCEVELLNKQDLSKLMTEQQYQAFCAP